MGQTRSTTSSTKGEQTQENIENGDQDQNVTRAVNEENTAQCRGREIDLQSLYLLSQSGTGDQSKAELKRQDVTCPIDDIRLLGTCQQVRVGDVSGPNQGKTLLHIACSHGNASTVKALLELGASPLQCTGMYINSSTLSEGGGESCVHLAAEAGSGDVIDVLRRHGNICENCFKDLVNASSHSKRTPLEVSAIRHLDIYKEEKGRLLVLKPCDIYLQIKQ